MKKLLLLSAISVAIASQSFAQVTVANGKMETWTSSTVGSIPFTPITIQKPTSWMGSDEILKNMEAMLTLGGYVLNVKAQLSKEEGAANVYEGAASARLETKNQGGDMGVTPCLMANGVMTINIDAATAALEGGEIDGLESIIDVTGGTAIGSDRKVDSVTAYLKGAATLNADSSSIFVQAKRISGDSMITIGGGIARILGNDEFQKVVVNVEYTDPTLTATDTLIIFVVSSATTPTESSMFGATEGNAIYVDDFSVFTSAGSTSVSKYTQTNLGVNVYPIPAGSELNFENAKVKNAVINIYNSLGQLMHQEFTSIGRTSVNVSKYAAGNYFYEFINADNYQKQVGQFVK